MTTALPAVFPQTSEATSSLAMYDRIEAAIDSFSTRGSRVTGYSGNTLAARYIESVLQGYGVDTRRDTFTVTVPIETDSRLVIGEGEENIPLYGMWPNNVRTTTVPAEGLTLPLVYGGYGEYSDLEGVPLQDRLVLMEFNSWDHWVRAAQFGARAFLFIEPEETSYLHTVAKHARVPLDVPRFWISRDEGLQLRQWLVEGHAPTVTLHSRMAWREKPTWNIWGTVPGKDPALRDEVVVVDAYYDGISVVPRLGPSAETSCSVIALLELARHLQTHPPARTIILSASAAHFQAQRGMVDFLERHARRDEEYVKRMEEPLHVDLFISLDLSSQTDQIAIWNNTTKFELKRLFVPFSRRFTRYAKEVAGALGRPTEHAFANGISPIKGIDWATLVPGGIETSGVVAWTAGQLALSFVTTHDARLAINSPLDHKELVRIDNLERQIDFLNGILTRSFDDPALLENSEEFNPVLKDVVRTHDVKVRAFPRRDQIPNHPAPPAVVTEGLGFVDKGVHDERHYLTNADGDVSLHGLTVGRTTGFTAYVMDEGTGAILFAPDLSERAQKFSGGPGFSGRLSWQTRWTTDEKTIVLFPCLPGALYGVSSGADKEMKIVDRTGRAPRQFGYARGRAASVVFADRDLPIKTDGLKILGAMLLNSPGGTDENSARGLGYHFARDRLTPTSYYMVRDMMRLNEARLHTMRTHAIENHAVSRFQELGSLELQKADAAIKDYRWEDYARNISAAQGMISRAYPEVIGTLNDVIKGMVFFLALVIPAAFFAERLLLASPDIRWQLAGFFGFLILVWLVISQVHPAFQIAHPLVVLLAFAIMAMAVFVMLMVTNRFNRSLREYHAEQARVHQTDISRVSAAYTAFLLGISNMRRRKLRTGLTLGTITLLTFTVLSFSSFKPDVRFFSFSHTHDGSYEGALIRHHNWNWISQLRLETATSFFGDRVVIAPRGWYIADPLEEKKYIEIAHNEYRAMSTALLGLHPGETDITGVQSTIVSGRFFSEDNERTCLISSQLAETLHLGKVPSVTDSVRVLGEMLRVAGVFDPESFERVRDLDNEPLTPVDFHRGSEQVVVRPQAVDVANQEEETRAFLHLRPENVVILPYETLRAAGGDLRSVALKFRSKTDIRGLIKDFITQTPMTIFAGIRDELEGRIAVASYTALGLTAVEGFQALVVPMLIAGLIILNAMMGAVYERFREIDIYSAVGLAPMHIALLFVAEACVYSVIGVTLGYVLGQAVGKVMVVLNLAAGISLNYSSMAAILSATTVMAIVLLSTLYPARVAARAAVPDLVRRWKPPSPEGDRWEFEFPFMVSRAEVLGICGFLANFFDAYKEESIGDFYAEKVTLTSDDSVGGRVFSVQMLTWLAPFDMGVSQYLQLDFLPAVDETLDAKPKKSADSANAEAALAQTADIGIGIYTVEVFIHRLSGQDTYWERVNQRFMNTLRKQFLLWHTLSDDARAYHREKAVALLSAEIVTE